MSEFTFVKEVPGRGNDLVPYADAVAALKDPEHAGQSIAFTGLTVKDADKITRTFKKTPGIVVATKANGPEQRDVYVSYNPNKVTPKVAEQPAAAPTPPAPPVPGK